MATPVIMPRQGQSVESCIIGKWHKKAGDPVAVGDILFTYETDKATFDETATVAGTMLVLFFAEGDDVPCLTNVCVIGQPGEDYSMFVPGGAVAATEIESESPESTIESKSPESGTLHQAFPPQGEQDLMAPSAISPRAKNLAERSGADLRMAAGSGPSGRVIERDVRALIDAGLMATPAAGVYTAGTVGTGIGGRVTVGDTMAPSAPAPVAATAVATVDASESYTEKHSTIRKVIAKTMSQSLSTMAQLTHNSSFDATEIIALRRKLKMAADQGLADKGFTLAESVPTLGDIVLYAVSRVLLRHPACNAHYDDDKMTYFKHVNSGCCHRHTARPDGSDHLCRRHAQPFGNFTAGQGSGR